jgi:FixJ family two-component response regulator
MNARSLRVYVVDDDPSVRNSLRALLVAHRFEVVVFSSAEDFLGGADRDVPACLLLDLRMPGMSGMELLAHLQQESIGFPIIILTAHGDVPVAVRAMKAGALDFIQKPVMEAHILSAIEHAAQVLADRPPAALPKEEVARRLARLTTREREVLDHLVLGQTNKTIADELGISQRTVEIHRARIREKLEARGLADLIRMVREAPASPPPVHVRSFPK